MSHKLHRLAEKIKEEPLLITPAGLNIALSYLEERNRPDEEMAILGGRKRNIKELAYMEETQTGVISVSGPISYIQYQPMCAEEVASYQRIQSEFDAMVEAGAKTVVFDFDTPGGQAYGCMETGKYLRDKADANDIKLIGYADGDACSAGYGLLSSMHEKIANPDASVGSIGVMVHLVNASKARKAMGLEDVYIYAGKNKIPFDDEGNIKQEYKDKLQARVEKTYTSFVNHVHEMTGLSVEAIRDTNAEVFDAEEALNLGLLDATMNREEFFGYLADVTDARQEGKTMSIAERFKTKAQNEEGSEEMNKEALESISKLESQMAEVQTVNEELTATVATLTEKLTTANSVIEQYKTDKEKAEQTAAEVKQASRLEKLSAVLPKDEAEKMNTELSSLGDATFESIVSKLSTKESEETSSEMFSEAGVGGEGSATKQDEQFSEVNKLIAERNQKKSA